MEDNFRVLASLGMLLGLIFLGVGVFGMVAGDTFEQARDTLGLGGFVFFVSFVVYAVFTGMRRDRR